MSLSDKARELLELKNQTIGYLKINGIPSDVDFSTFATLHSAEIAQRMLELEAENEILKSKASQFESTLQETM